MLVCNRGYPGDCFIELPPGEPRLALVREIHNFTHIDESMRFVVNELEHHRPPADAERYMLPKDAEMKSAFAQAGSNAPCPRGFGLKFKKCHGR